jgi:hypothetical protein
MKRHSESTTAAGRGQLCFLYDVHVKQSTIGLRLPSQPHFAFMWLLILVLQQSKTTSKLLLQLLQPRGNAPFQSSNLNHIIQITNTIWLDLSEIKTCDM